MLLRIRSPFENLSTALSKFPKNSRCMGVSSELPLDSWYLSLIWISGGLWHIWALAIKIKKCPGIAVWACGGSWFWLGPRMTWAVCSGRENGPGSSWSVRPKCRAIWRLATGGPWRGEATSDLLLRGCSASYVGVPVISLLFSIFLGVPRMGAGGWRYRMDCTLSKYVPALWQIGGNRPQHHLWEIWPCHLCTWIQLGGFS